MSRSRRFKWGESYLLTDMGGDVFHKEPAIYVGKKDSDMERPTICAVCGQPLGSEGYHTFFLMGPNGRGRDMMFGNVCIKDRIQEKHIGIQGENPRDTLERVTEIFPECGRWYGTFLHHSVAKPYVRDKEVMKKWNESILKLPGVRFILKTIDDLRDEGWELDAEKILECGNVDLLATHPEKGTLVFDWKSDISFLNKDAYIEQIHRYMSELSRAGIQKISGYILWIRNGEREYVSFNGISEPSNETSIRSRTHLQPIKCTLNIDMDGGEGIRKKKIVGYSIPGTTGDVVTFYIPPCEPFKEDYEFTHFEASPYNETDRWGQSFNKNDLENGFRVSFVCSKKRHTFTLTAHWNRVAPLKCSLEVYQNNDNGSFNLYASSEKDENGVEFVTFRMYDVNIRLGNREVSYLTLINEDLPVGTRSEWAFDDLSDHKSINIPCSDEHCNFKAIIETKPRRMIEKKSVKKESNQISSTRPSEQDIDYSSSQQTVFDMPTSVLPLDSNYIDNVSESTFLHTSDHQSYAIWEYDDAEYHFTPGRIYESGGRYYGIYKRLEHERPNTAGKVDVAEVDCDGNKISNLEWRHIYITRGGKEFIYGISDLGWKIYTKNVLLDISPKEMDRFG